MLNVLNTVFKKMLKGLSPAETDSKKLLKGDKINAIKIVSKDILTLQSQSDNLKAQIAELQAQKKAIDETTAWAKGVILETMQANNLGKILDPIAPISIQMGKPVIEVENIDFLPEEFLRVKVEANKIELAKAIKAGAELEGVTLTQNPYVKIG